MELRTLEAFIDTTNNMLFLDIALDIMLVSFRILSNQYI